MTHSANSILEFFIEKNGSDLYLTVGSPPCMRLHDRMELMEGGPLNEEDMDKILHTLLSSKAIAEFESTFECNAALSWRDDRRLRINAFRQRQSTGMVIRRVQTAIPTLTELNLPALYGDIIMERRGLILIVGPTGSGKSSSLASMVGHRNLNGSGHIVMIEDPIEFEHQHHGCIITQRDVGIDTLSYGNALRNALRQMPDVIVIGEIRDSDTMENAIAFAETGHLCVATLHANNTNQAIERALNFFPEDRHKQILMSLSLNLRAVLSQRLVPNVQGTRSIAIEIMFNQGQIRELILEGKLKEIREQVEKGRAFGMQTFEQALLYLFEQNIITEETALAEADSPANLRLAMRSNSISRFRLAADIMAKPAEIMQDKKQF